MSTRDALGATKREVQNYNNTAANMTGQQQQQPPQQQPQMMVPQNQREQNAGNSSNQKSTQKMSQMQKMLWKKKKKLQNFIINKKGVLQYVDPVNQQQEIPQKELIDMRDKYGQATKVKPIQGVEQYKDKRQQEIKKLIFNEFKYKQPEKRQLTNEQMFQIDYEKPQKYQVGEFTSFAKSQEKLIQEKQKYIAFVLKQAVISYQKKYKQNYQAVKKLLEHQQSQQIEKYFKDPQDLKKFIENQISFSINQAIQEDKFQIYKTASKYVLRKMVARQNAIIDGKFLKLSQLKMQQRFYHNGLIYIPTDKQQIYIKITPTGQPKKVILMQNRFFQQHQIHFLNQQAKKQIVSTVIDFLLSKGQIMNKQQVQIYIKAHMDKIFPISK